MGNHELPAKILQLSEKEAVATTRLASPAKSVESEAVETNEEAREAEKLRNLSEVQSRQLQLLALRCAGLERRANLLNGEGSVASGSVHGDDMSIDGGLTDLDQLQSELMEQRRRHQRKTSELREEMHALRRHCVLSEAYAQSKRIQ